MIDQDSSNEITKEALLSNDAQQAKLPYDGDYIEKDTAPLDFQSDLTTKRKDGYQKFDFADAAEMLCFYDEFIQSGAVTLYPWQTEMHEGMAAAKPTAKHPYKQCLVAANGSGKDAFIAAPFAVWFILCKIRSRCIITSSSGTQLTGQTEPGIRSLCEKINNFHQQEIFKIRQRFIYCRLTGSEIRMFATDEAGKAEGYHPIEPGAEMAILVNEGKSVTEEIHNALRRCTGFNYWLEYSSPGQESGFFYNAAMTWRNVKYVTSLDCPEHLSAEEREQDKIDLGEHSALYRSKHLAQFTSLGGDVIITSELVRKCLANPPQFDTPSLGTRIGIDLAAGGDENVVTIVSGNRVIKEVAFRETDTTITADRINRILLDNNIAKTHKHIYADDGGVGRAIIDMLVRRRWKISRVMNQWPAFNKKDFGNRGAENWYRVKRIIEENMIDISTLSKLCRDQLVGRHYKQGSSGAKIYLESKKEAKGHGHKSPDRADAFILAFTGLTLDDFLKAKPVDVVGHVTPDGETSMTSNDEVLNYYTENVQYGDMNSKTFVRKSKKHCRYSLSAAIGKTNNYDGFNAAKRN